MDQVERQLQRDAEVLSSTREDELREKVNVLKERFQSLHLLAAGEDNTSKKRRSGFCGRIAKSLIEENRLKRRKLGAGAKPKLDSDDETFIAECIEEHATIHGRRSESVLYTAHRVKQKDLLSIANYTRMKLGKSLVKSVTTVLNRGRPKNIHSIQAKQHKGKWLFCSKKPPKTAMEEKIHTRHQRQARKLVKHAVWNDKSTRGLSMVLSKDDKAYLRPGTSVGADGLRHGKMYMLSDPEKQPALPQHDWPSPKLYITPSAHRFICKKSSGKSVRGEEQFQTVEDYSVVTVRPKYIIGSSGSVWASDYMMLRVERPDLYEVKDLPDCTYFTLKTRQVLAAVQDSSAYFLLTNNKESVHKITKSTTCPFRQYEIERVSSLLKLMASAGSRASNCIPQVHESEKRVLTDLMSAVQTAADLSKKLLHSLKEEPRAVGKNLWENFSLCGQKWQAVNVKLISLNLPPLRPRVVEFTDAGPGVAANNYEVRFRDQEIVHVVLHNSSQRVRIHLATDDQGQNEAERVNAYIGDAVSDGTSLKTGYFGKHHGLSEDDLNKMTCEEIDAYEDVMAKKNAWCIAEDVRSRIHDEPGPGKSYMQAFLTPRKDE